MPRNVLKPKYIPDTTNVAECNKAEIGVGAAIALINQAENGNCADLVQMETNKQINNITLKNMVLEQLKKCIIRKKIIKILVEFINKKVNTRLKTKL